MAIKHIKVAIKKEVILNTAIKSCYFLIIIFLSYVVMNKMLNIESFRSNIFKTGLFAYNTAKYISILVIIAEFAVLMLMVFRKTVGLMTFAAMLIVYTIYITYLYYENLYELCGCGGILNLLSFKNHFTINLTLILASSLCFDYYSKNSSVND